MTEFAPLATLSAEEVVATIRGVARDERKLKATTIGLLAEVEEDKLYEEFDCCTLLDFCVSILGLTPGEARARAYAACLARRFPSILGRIERGELHLTGLLALRKHLTRDNHEELLNAASGKSTRAIREMVAERFPGAVRPLPPMRVRRVSDTHVRIAFTARSELQKTIKRAVALMRRRDFNADVALAVEAAMDLLLAELQKDLLPPSEPASVERAPTSRSPRARRSSGRRPAAVASAKVPSTSELPSTPSL